MLKVSQMCLGLTLSDSSAAVRLLFWLLFLTCSLPFMAVGQGSPTEQVSGKEKIVVGYLPAVRGTVPGRQGISISGAVSLAIQRINNRTDLLPGVELDLVWSDTEGDTIRGTKILTDMLCNDTAAFFGPEFSCAVEATVAAAWNRTMISYLCSDGSVSNKERYPTFARTEAPDHQVVKSVLSLMDHYNWKIFQIISQTSPTNRYAKVAENLFEEARKLNMTPKEVQEFNDDLQTVYWFGIVNTTKAVARIFVFIGESKNLVEMMGTMDSLKMFDEGEYLVIYIDMETYDPKEAFKYLWRLNDFNQVSNCHYLTNFEDRIGRSLLVVAPSQPNENYEAFSKQVTDFSNKPPFNFRDSLLGAKYRKHVSIYAANLYDSVFLYAKALDSLWIRKNRTVDIQELARDGRGIFKSIIEMKSYESITGARISIDENGDSEGNYTVIAYVKQPYEWSNFTCDHGMFPVANFHSPTDIEGNSKRLPKIKFFPGKKIEWEQPPADSPKCGFKNEHCVPSTFPRSIITAASLGFVLIVVLVGAASLYRKWKIEQEIEGLLWKIDKDELQFQQRFGEHSQSRMSLVSAGSIGQAYCDTARYKGALVRVKVLKLQKKHLISRQTMKEMRYMREMGHPNINKFFGAVIQPMEISLVYDYCGKGSLYDVAENEDVRLDHSFTSSLIHDLIKGMIYLHESDIGVHGNLKSSNCAITSQWSLQLTDFGLSELQLAASAYETKTSHAYYQNLFWKAPELLREKGPIPIASQKGDVYAFAIILYEIYGRKGPYGLCENDPKDIVEQVKQGGNPPFRPDLTFLEDCPSQCPDYVLHLMTDAWDEFPENRPTFRTIRERLKPLKEGICSNIVDQMMKMMEKYTHNLEDLVSIRTAALEQEKLKTEDLLHRMLPMPVARRLTMGDGIEPETFEMVTIYFSDIVGFTQMSAESTPFQVVNFLNDLYTLFDSIIKGYDVYKVETIGDAYMVVSGCPIRNADHAGHIASMALDLRQAILTYRIAHRPNETLKLRIGMHSGPVCAGVVGLTMPRYCLFGDTVNTSSRMESNGEPLKIHISNECKEALDAVGGYITEERGHVHLKGKGNVLTHWLVASTEGAIQRQEVEDMSDLRPLFSRPTAFTKHFPGNGVGGNFSDQQSFRRRASPKVAGSVNVSRQGSFCAGQGSGNPLLTARNSSYYLRRPSFDPAMLSHSLRNSQLGSSSIQNGSNSAVNRNSPSPNRRIGGIKPNPVKVPTSRRRGSVSAGSTCSDGGGQGSVPERPRIRRPVTEFCAVTIEPPSDSSTPASPDSSPVKTLITKVQSAQELKQESPGSPARKKVGFVGRKKKKSLGSSGREFHSLDQIPDETLESPLIAPILKTRKLSKSLDIPEDLTELIDCNKGDGMGKKRTYSKHDHSNQHISKAGEKPPHQPPHHQYDDASSLDERAEDSHLLGKDKENCRTNEDYEVGDLVESESFDEDDGSGLRLEVGRGDEGKSRKSNQTYPLEIPKSKKDNWAKEKRGSGGSTGGATVKKWFQNILNGNGMTTSAPSTTPPAAMNKSSIHHFPLDEESNNKLLDNKSLAPPPTCITEHESVV